MKSDNVFTKAAKKLNLKYIGSRNEGRFLFGYFEDSEGRAFKSFYFPSIKKVVSSLIEEGAEAA